MTGGAMRIKKNLLFLSLCLMITLLMGCTLGSTPAPASTEVPTVAVTSGPTAIAHTVIPVDLPAERSSHAGDNDSSVTASKKVAAGGDRFTYGRFERPFNANTMDMYFSQLDIVDTFVYQDDTWIFGKIMLNKLDSSNTQGSNYALELDFDRDGKGDWLVIASNPASTDWTVNGVKVYQDANKDVGNKTAMFSDKNATGDGYETLVFDQGTGNDPDTASGRLSPTEPNTVEIAIKRSVLGDTQKYLIDICAGTSLLDLALFDINDHFTHEQAGAADAGLELFYPIKQVSEIDNSCKMAVGFEPTGQEPGLCETLIPHVPGAPIPGCNLSPAVCNPQGMSFDSTTCTCVPVG